MNFSIFRSNFSLKSSHGLDVVKIARFRRNSSNLGTTWAIKEESLKQENNSWKYLSFFQILASTVKLIDYFKYVLVLLRVTFLSRKQCSDILMSTYWTRFFCHSFIFCTSNTSTWKIIFIYYFVDKTAKNFLLLWVPRKTL